MRRSMRTRFQVIVIRMSDFDLDEPNISPGIDLTYANGRFYVLDWGDRNMRGDREGLCVHEFQVSVIRC